MLDRSVRNPGPGHPITIEPHRGRVVVKAAGRAIADTTRALALREAAYRAVFYIPRADVDMAALERTDHRSHCPYKGEASYFSIPAGGARAANAVWTYEAPHRAVAAIEGYLAFHPDRVDAIKAASV